MPPIVDINKCNGCGKRLESLCEEICPGNLMARNKDTGKAYCRSSGDCWDCMSCIKSCPLEALTIKIPYQLGYHKASLRPIMEKNRITWECIDIYGNKKIYSYKNRIETDK